MGIGSLRVDLRPKSIPAASPRLGRWRGR